MTTMRLCNARDLLLTLALAAMPAVTLAAGLRLIAEGPAQDFGFSVAPAGDVNGDDIPDVIVGAPSYEGIEDFAGRAYLFLGPFDGDRAAEDADATISAVNFGDNMGFSVASAGDTNGDGFDDILVGARSNDDRGIQAGQAYLFRGPVQGDLHVEDADAVISGNDFAELGRAVAAAGDLNNDGIGDIAIGAPLANGGGVSAGQVLVFNGPVSGMLTPGDADAVINGLVFNELLGTSVSAAGDLNDDGIGDLVIGAPRPNLSGSGTGNAYVFYGPVSGQMSANQADATIVGERLNDEFGSSVSAAGDLDGDGHDDLFVGADQFSAGLPGKAYVFHGPIAGVVSAGTAAAILVGEAREDIFGSSVAVAGDVNGDGFGDFIVGGEFSDSFAPHSGRAFLYLGPLSGTVTGDRAHAVFTGKSGDAVGISVARAGDLDSDGRADLLIGAYGGDGVGYTQVLFGADLVPASLRVAVAAIDGPVEIPAAGGNFDFQVVIRNLSAQPQTIQLWTSLLKPPAHTPQSPVLGPVQLTLPPGATLRRTFNQIIPASFPAGTSLLVANVRNPADTVGDIANLRFTKAGAGD